VTALLTALGGEKVEIGMPVEMVTRRIRSDGDECEKLVYGYMFRPVMQGDLLVKRLGAHHKWRVDGF
jgi:uncharacterized protein